METIDLVDDEAVIDGTEGADPEAAVEAADGQVEATDPTPDAPLPEEPKYLDLSQYGDHLVRIKVNGQDVELPASELPNAAMMHADYTRKTQELSFWRQVDEAMRNPQTAPAALQYLAQTFGVQNVQEQQVPEEEEYSDPIERRLAQIEAQARQANEYVSQQQAAAYLNQVVTGLSQKYADFDAVAVVDEAIKRGVDDPGRLEDVYKLMQFDRMMAQNAAQQLATQQAAAQQQARQAAAQQAAAVVTAGPSATAAGMPAASQPRPNSVAEAWAAAKRELGID